VLLEESDGGNDTNSSIRRESRCKERDETNLGNDDIGMDGYWKRLTTITTLK